MEFNDPFTTFANCWIEDFKLPSRLQLKSLERLAAINPWYCSNGRGEIELERLNQSIKTLPLSKLRPDILDALLLSGDIPECRMLFPIISHISFLRGRSKLLENKYGTGYLYFVTTSLAHSEKALDDLLEHLQAGNDDVEKTVLPIFYGVDPSDVRNQTGCFAEAFANYEKKYKDEPQKVERWRAALTKLGNLAGWDSKHYCFRGKDTRLNFTNHLYDALIQCRISTFEDDKDLPKGMSIRKQLEKSFEESRVWVVIVSPNYASSKWCLDELLKILQCRKASKVAKKNGTLMKASGNDEDQRAHTSVDGDKTHKKKASLRNKENISIHDKRKMGEIRLGVNYGGKWVGSVYIGERFFRYALEASIEEFLSEVLSDF
ncbi:hypothetical protein ACLB2K_029010 [Fragaria x ananassa]